MVDNHGFDFARRSLVAALLFIAVVISVPANAQGLDDLLPAQQTEEPATDARVIDVETDAVTDDNIRKRLNGIYSELDTLEGIAVQVTNGIVTLSGTVSSSQTDERAIEIANQVNGVIEVVNELTIDTNVGRRIESTIDRLEAIFTSLIVSLPVLLLALLIVVAFWFLGRWTGLRSGVFRALAPNAFIADLFAILARGAVVLTGVILALTLLDATSIIGSVLGAAGIIGLALGFAVRDTVENFIASILLSLRTPFVTRDYVRIGEYEGMVARLTSRATILISLDGNQLRVPNALVYKAVIINFTRQPERRFEFAVGVDTDLDLNAAQQTALDTIYGVAGVLAEPAASVLVTELGDSNVSLTVRAWIDQRQSDHLKVRSEAIRQVKQAFDDAGIAMPEPIYRVRFQEGMMSIGESPLPSSGNVQDTKSSTGDESTSTSGSEVGKPDPNVTKPGVDTPPRTPREDAPSADASDTSADASFNRSLERELSDTKSENLLHGDNRIE